MEDRIKLAINEVNIGNGADTYRTLRLQTNRGEINARYYHIQSVKQAVIFVGGVAGGFDSPAGNLYATLAERLLLEGISSLRIQFRNPTDLIESIIDVMAGIMFLEQNGFEHIGLVGHAFGSAAIIQAAINASNIKTVVCLATQGLGSDSISSLSEDTSLLLVHGKRDKILPYPIAEYAYTLAHDPKELLLMDGAGHDFDEVKKDVYVTLHEWLVHELKSKYAVN